MIRDRPYGAELLIEARRLMAQELACGISTENRYQALMIDRAMDLAAKELAADSGLEDKLIAELGRIIGARGSAEELAQMLSQRIRAGEFDGAGEVHQFLRLVTVFKLRETNPEKADDILEE